MNKTIPEGVEIEVRPITDFEFDPDNANKGSERGDALLDISQERYGWGRSILITEDRRVIAGNKSLAKAGERGADRVLEITIDGDMPVALRRRDLKAGSPEAVGLALADNVTAIEGIVFDFEVIELQREAHPEELEWWFPVEVAPTPVEPPDDLAASLALVEKWKVVRGEVWAFGDHRLMCGDSTSEADVLKALGDMLPTFIFADPPYGVDIVAANGYVGGGEAYNIPFGGVKKGRGSIGGAAPFGKKDVRGTDGASHIVEVGKYLPVKGDESTETAIKSSTLLLGLYPDAVHVWWGAHCYASALQDSKGWIVWDKEMTGNFGDGELAWTNQDRAIRFFRHQWNGMLRASERERRSHPTQKPVALATWCLNEYGREPGALLDPFAGRGTGFLAAHSEGWPSCSIEWEETYCALILETASNMGLTPAPA